MAPTVIPIVPTLPPRTEPYIACRPKRATSIEPVPIVCSVCITACPHVHWRSAFASPSATAVANTSSVNKLSNLSSMGRAAARSWRRRVDASKRCSRTSSLIGVCCREGRGAAPSAGGASNSCCAVTASRK